MNIFLTVNVIYNQYMTYNTIIIYEKVFIFELVFVNLILNQIYIKNNQQKHSLVLLDIGLY